MKIRITQSLPLAKEHVQILSIGSEHSTIEPPKTHAKNTRISECWVSGFKKEPVKLLRHEFEVISQ